ncbi:MULTISPECIES: helix-turn-helix transcriptional regulator [Burkholderia]|uniref:AlpA family phage regulatory protein n=2 Tax=Burkholderia contaminans TaxID=488447 RepID=A0A250LFN0_9BURK|nr:MULTISPECIES: AlpA family phage regulatory protein [Burkholderia]MBH9690798.1 AlpA family phage regulatory protein [Burkholderia contaminans]MBK1912473.1 AlpA family phage regulatory protein [Burkholderia contaminans]MBK1926756.1 AlpA family phage regulatory protein [Burkholderia contaminans]MBK1934333.1 AlpA family phage regulatory protein [Burkholderia contaminans]MBK1942042.1 AlpA family phage regulatory protein [Burkholderia contaminans]
MQSNGVQVQVRVKLPSGPLIEPSNFCKAIAEALRPTAAQHFDGIECIVGKMQRYRVPMPRLADNGGQSAPEHLQVAPRSESEHAPDHPLRERHGAEEVHGASELPKESDSRLQIVELSEAPYRLTEDDRRALSRLLPGLPSLRYPNSDEDKAAFLDAWLGLKERPSWEPILMTAADMERYKFEQSEIQVRHQLALRDEFARGQLSVVDARYAPVVALAPGSFILRESAVAYLSRCGLVPDDGDVNVDAGCNNQSPEPTRAPATMPPQARAPKVQESVAPSRDQSDGHVVEAKENDLGSKGSQVDMAGLPQPTPDSEKRKVGKVARLPRVIELTGLKRSSIYYRMNPHSRYYDPTFPQCFSLSTSENGAVGWDEERVCAWVAARVARRK